MWFLFFYFSLAWGVSNLDLAKERFEAIKTLDYSYEYKNEEAFEVKVVTVRSGRVESIVVKKTGMPYEYSPGTGEEILQEIMNALNNNKIVEVTYDNVFGIPSGDVKIDTEAFAYDGGKWWVISNFKILSPCPSLPNCVSCVASSCFWQSEVGCSKACAVQDVSCFGQDSKCPALGCTKELLVCPDGSHTSRNSYNNCYFDYCPPIACPADAKLCPDGSSVSRDPRKNCEFPDCTRMVLCAADIKKCPDGTLLSRDPQNGCEFPKCNVGPCLDDVKECPDGSWVSRDPKNGCEFQECAVNMQCDPDVKECQDGSFVYRLPERGCDFDDCPEVSCPDDTKECPDGTWVSRDPKNNCKFEECPVLFCPLDVRKCPDGSWVSRDPKTGCQFKECPTVMGCQEDIRQCPDGSTIIRDPNNNCEFPECTEHRLCAQDVKQCPDGTFVSRDPKNGCSFPKCSSPLLCAADIRKCPDGTWISRDPSRKCQFPSCPIRACTREFRRCKDGSSVGRDSSRGCSFELCPEEVFPYLTTHKPEIEDYLTRSTPTFSAVRIVDLLENEDIVVRLVSTGNEEPSFDNLRKAFASFIGIHPERVSVSRFVLEESSKRQESGSHWLVTLSVDNTSASSALRAGVTILVLVFGWLWI